MARPCIAEILESGVIGARATVSGWVRSRRDSKTLSFVVLNDGSTIQTLQVVVDATLEGYQDFLPRLTTGASVTIEGELVESPGKGQRVELRAESLTVLGDADPETYPLQKKGHTMEFLRSIAHLRSRSNVFGAVFRIRAALAQATHRFFAGRHFHYVHTPIITASDCEGAGAMFEVKANTKEAFFGRPAMLTVSGQLNAEAMAYGLGRVYTFGPTFRAENSNTNRHLAEFWMIEPEMAFCDLHGGRAAEACDPQRRRSRSRSPVPACASMAGSAHSGWPLVAEPDHVCRCCPTTTPCPADDMQCAEDYVRYCCRHLLDNCRADLNFINSMIDKTAIARLEQVGAFARRSFRLGASEPPLLRLGVGDAASAGLRCCGHSLRRAPPASL